MNEYLRIEPTNEIIIYSLIALAVLIIILSPLFTAIIKGFFRGIRNIFRRTSSEEEKIITIQEIQTTVDALRKEGKGATIVIDTKLETDEYLTDSEVIDSKLSSNLLINIFEGSKTPLHDGAVIVRDGRIASASAYITNLTQQNVPKKFGTRHRSALGLSEVTKAIIIVVSEETNKITIFHKSKFEEVSSRDLFGKISNIWK